MGLSILTYKFILLSLMLATIVTNCRRENGTIWLCRFLIYVIHCIKCNFLCSLRTCDTPYDTLYHKVSVTITVSRSISRYKFRSNAFEQIRGGFVLTNCYICRIYSHLNNNSRAWPMLFPSTLDSVRAGNVRRVEAYWFEYAVQMFLKYILLGENIRSMSIFFFLKDQTRTLVFKQNRNKWMMKCGFVFPLR